MTQWDKDVLVVVDVAVSLDELGGLVGGMAGKEEVVTGLDHPGETHKQERVYGQGTSHVSRDHLGILLDIGNSSQRKSPVSDYR